MNQLAAGIGVLFGIFTVALIGILIAYILFSFGGKKRADQQYILYLEITRQAILEVAMLDSSYRGPRKLYRMNFPWVGDLNAVAAECLKTCKEIDELEKTIGKEKDGKTN